MGVLVLILIVALVVAYNVYFSPNAKWVRSLCRGKNADQVKAIRYLLLESKILRSIYGLTDEGYLDMVHEKVSTITKQKAMDKLGVDEDQVKEIDPVQLEGFTFNNEWARKNEKGTWVSSRYCVTWLFFSKEQVYVYQYAFNLDEDKKRESTQEYFYTDVTSLSTSTLEEKIKISDKGVQKEESHSEDALKLVVPGDSVSIYVNNDSDNIEMTIQAVKQLLREKKKK